MANDLTKPGSNITVFARRPAEMEASQASLIQWATNKIASVQGELVEARENYEIAHKNKWRSRPFARQVKNAERRLGFYEKIKQALESGYYIVPPFPVDLFAIRTDRKQPLPKRNKNRWDVKVQMAKALPAGEGRYVSPIPTIWRKHLGFIEKDNGRQISDWEFWAKEHQDVDFPFKLVKPTVLESVGDAMKKKIFDQFGALPAFQSGGDPIVVGQILHYKQNRAPITFFVSWWLDTEDL